MHLTEAEIDRLLKVARREGRYGARDATAIMLAFRHGLRAAELVGLQWSQFDLARATMHVNRVKGGDPRAHYLNGTELRALRKLQAEWPNSRYLFVSERGDPVTTAWFRKMFARLGRKAEMPFPINPHMLRHSCGYKFANEGKDTRSLQGYLGHRNAQSTVRYTQLAPDRFKGWETE
jgi:type 1 fimbriae regulatory protein FimB/type 1 fimbriae regulatory protein FimE